MAYKKRVDFNQADIVAALRDPRVGATVRVRSSLGCGIPDLEIKTRTNRVFWLECKAPGEKLTADELDFAEWWVGQVYIARSVEEAVELVQDFDMEA